MPHIQTIEATSDNARFLLEPLERGYGQTIGNALRRVLLSSIHGAAVCAVRIDKVFHEFAPIPGVKEDTTEFLLNVKNIAVRMDFDGTPPEEVVLRLDVKGPGRVTGADIECPEGVTVVNPEVYLATLSDANAGLVVEFYACWGVGYTLPERQEKYKGIIGLIPLGSQFTPVTKVNYIVEQIRVGQRTDYERMILDVSTNGAVAPNDAVTQAAHILDKFFRMFFDVGSAGIDPSLIDDLEFNPELAHVPDVKLEELELSPRTFNSLRRTGLLTLRHLAAVTDKDLNSIRGFGKKSLLEVREKLAAYGVELKSTLGGIPVSELAADDDH